MKKTIKRIAEISQVVTVMMLPPFVLYAQDFGNLLERVKGYLRTLLPIAIGLALLVFIWGVIIFISAGDDKRAEGRQKMLWGIIGLFVIVSIWGLVSFIGNSIGVVPGGPPPASPGIPGLP